MEMDLDDDSLQENSAEIEGLPIVENPEEQGGEEVFPPDQFNPSPILNNHDRVQIPVERGGSLLQYSTRKPPLGGPIFSATQIETKICKTMS